MKKILLSLSVLLSLPALAGHLLVPMDTTQARHLKAYGAVYEAMRNHLSVQWLLNYRGGAWLIQSGDELTRWMNTRQVTYSNLSETETTQLLDDVGKKQGAAAITMELAPAIAVYVPSWNIPVDDAVLLALKEAEIPYTTIYDNDILKGDISRFDFIHLHHEDFTGQFGKFWNGYRNADWYLNEKKQLENIATANGYTKVSQLKLDVAKKLKSWIASGGHLFAMCSASDSYDIALAAEGLDICDSVFDGDGFDAQASSKLDYSKCLAFRGFTVFSDKTQYEFSDIDTYSSRSTVGVLNWKKDAFTLHDFDAATNPELAMLTQAHQKRVQGFWGMTTGFKPQFLKPDVSILAAGAYPGEVNYISGKHEKGSWTFLSGHDPEDYQHRIGDPATDLSKFPNSQGYRLILNNIMRSSVSPRKTSTTITCSVFPNPVSSGNATVSVSLPETTSLVISIYGISGNLIRSEQVGERSGEIQHALSLEGMAAGIYEVEVKAGATVQQMKLVIQ